MRASALLFGGLVAGVLLSASGADAFWMLDPSMRQPLAQPQPVAPYGARTDPGPGLDSTDRLEPGAVRQARGPGRDGVRRKRRSAGAKAFAPISRQIVEYRTAHAAGTVVVDTSERRLYYVLGEGKAVRYGIGVGRQGFQWTGTHRVSTKREWPDWRPPAEMLQRQPYLPRHMPGGPKNPLGARALYIGSTEYRIHGTNEPWSIGRAMSSGCIRMANADVIDLYGRVKVGAKVVVQH